MDLGAVEIRVLGCLVEKQRATPDAYPLTLNALRLACNQSTNRHPVLELDEATIRAALERLSRRRLVRLASGQGSRAPKYRHLLPDALGLSDDELALLALLMLRGPQTPGELKARSERLHPFADLAAVHGGLERLVERGHVQRLERRPGRKEERYAQMLGGADGGADRRSPAAETGPPAGAEASADPPGRLADSSPSLEERVRALEREVAALREALDRREPPA